MTKEKREEFADFFAKRDTEIADLKDLERFYYQEMQMYYLKMSDVEIKDTEDGYLDVYDFAWDGGDE